MGIGMAVVLVLLGWGGYSLWRLHQDKLALQTRVTKLDRSVAGLEAELARVNKDNASLTDFLETERTKNSDLNKSLETEQNNNSNLAQALQAEQSRNNANFNQLQQLSGTVGTLTKLSQTDRELLQKYSKVYFLNENYVPSQLTAINPQYLYNKSAAIQIHTSVVPFLMRMFTAAAGDGINLQVISGYRSFGEQAAVKTGYKMSYGSGANKFSADQGYSEHQLGTTVDLVTSENKGSFTGFDKTKAYAWLVSNAHRFGFALSYPKGNFYYIYEPWHWRFVGTTLASKLHDSNQHFYDLTQREISQHLVSIFD